jgi:hypothetical protein
MSESRIVYFAASERGKAMRKNDWKKQLQRDRAGSPKQVETCPFLDVNR